MTLERLSFDGPIVIHCDNCPAVIETHCTNFAGALAKARAEGWIPWKDRHHSKWTHYCRECHD